MGRSTLFDYWMWDFRWLCYMCVTDREKMTWAFFQLHIVFTMTIIAAFRNQTTKRHMLIFFPNSTTCLLGFNRTFSWGFQIGECTWATSAVMIDHIIEIHCYPAVITKWTDVLENRYSITQHNILILKCIHISLHPELLYSQRHVSLLARWMQR